MFEKTDKDDDKQSIRDFWKIKAVETIHLSWYEVREKCLK